MVTIVFLFVCYVSVFIITVLLCLLLLCMLFLMCMVLNIRNFIQRTEQVPVELDISIEDYILLLVVCTHSERRGRNCVVSHVKMGRSGTLAYNSFR